MTSGTLGDILLGNHIGYLFSILVSANIFYELCGGKPSHFRLQQPMCNE